MTGRHPDTEEIIRAWLADSAPNRAPDSLRGTLEDVTSQPAGRGRGWPWSGRRPFQFVRRFAAAAAILAVSASGAYLLGGGLASPGKDVPSPSTQARPSATAATAATAVATTTLTPIVGPTVAQLPSSSWKLVDGALPKQAYGWAGNFTNPVVSLPGGGFLAFVLTAEGASNGPLSPSTTFQTRVFRSGDGLAWTEVAPLPADPTTSAYVAGVAESGGRIVAVGRAASGPDALPVPMVWTTTDLETWQAIELQDPHSASAWNVATGPSGFLVRGDSAAGMAYWASTDGSTWHSVVTSGLPADMVPDSLYSIPGGYAMRDAVDRARVWTSTDGATWSQAWQGPPSRGQESYAIGPILQVTGGRYVSFGAANSLGEPAVPPDLIVWSSADLIHWTEAARVQRPGMIWNFGRVPGGFVAAGFQAPDYSQLKLGVWTSADGLTWQLVQGLPSIETITPQVVSDGSHAIVVSIDWEGNLRLIVGDGLR
jgi:hypothetical protein